MKDQYKINKNPKTGWDLHFNNGMVSNHKTRKDAREAKKVWQDILDFSRVPEVEPPIRYFNESGEIYP